MRNKKSFLSLLIVGIVLVLVGSSYAFFDYNRVGANNELIAGDIYLNYEDDNTLNLSSIFPETMKKARSRDDNYITFTVSGRNGSDNDIYYEIDLMHGNEHSELTRFNDKDLRFDLYEVVDGTDNLIIGSVSFDELNNTPIWVDKVATGGHYNYDLEVFGNYYAVNKSAEGIEACQDFMYNFTGGDDYSDDQDGYVKACHNEGTIMGMDLPTLFDQFGNASMLEELDFVELVENPGYVKDTNNYNKEYKLRMWLSDDIIISDTESYADYSASAFRNHYASIKVKVSGSLEDRELPYTFMLDGSDANYELINIINDDDSIKTISFVKLDKGSLENRYNNAIRKVDLTRDESAINRVYAFIEDDELIIASDKLIVFPELCGGWFKSSALGGLFYELVYIENINFNNINTSRVRDFTGMFRYCENLNSLDLSNWDTYSAEYLMNIFDECLNLTSLDLSNFITNKVKDMDCMFYGCSSLINIDLSNFDTSNVINMRNMFYGCSSLININLSNFDTSNVTGMVGMFSDCSNLKKIYVGSNWNTTNVENGVDMFYRCNSLVGGNGTTYDANHTDEDYAHVDEVGNPGYFTLKTN